MDHETCMVKQIRSLDSDMQTLVYENYNKFISATGKKTPNSQYSLFVVEGHFFKLDIVLKKTSPTSQLENIITNCPYVTANIIQR